MKANVAAVTIPPMAPLESDVGAEHSIKDIYKRQRHYKRPSFEQGVTRLTTCGPIIVLQLFKVDLLCVHVSFLV